MEEERLSILLEAWNAPEAGARAALLERALAPGGIYYADPHLPDPVTDRAGLEAFLVEFRRRLPEGRLEAGAVVSHHGHACTPFVLSNGTQRLGSGMFFADLDGAGRVARLVGFVAVSPDPEIAPLAIELRGISKSFGAVQANKDIDLPVRRGTIHGIVGENGAGKSTLMSILYGFYQADAGEIRINGKAIRIPDSQAAIAAGIGMVHQHFMLVEPFTVLENVILGAEDGPCCGPRWPRRAAS